MDYSYLSPQMMALVTHTCRLVLASSHLGHLYLVVGIEPKDRSPGLGLDIPEFGLSTTIYYVLGLRQLL